MLDTQEKLEKVFAEMGIKGEWVDPDELGFSRTWRFEACGEPVDIIWYCNYSTLKIGCAEAWFTRIDTMNCYPRSGRWMTFLYGKDGKVHLKYKEDDYESL